MAQYIVLDVRSGIPERVQVRVSQDAAIGQVLDWVIDHPYDAKTDYVGVWEQGAYGTDAEETWTYDPEAYGKDLDPVESIYLQPCKGRK